MSYSYKNNQSYTYYSKQPAITISTPNYGYQNRYQGNQYPKQNQNFQWTKQQEEELLKLVQEQKDNVNWKKISYQLSRPVNNIQNKYTHLTEPEWTQSEIDFVQKQWKDINDKKEELNLENLVKNLNYECSCQHTLKGVQLQLERITERDKSLPQYKKPKEYVDREFKQQIKKISDKISEIMEKCQRSEVYDFVVQDLEQQCKDITALIEQQKEKDQQKQKPQQEQQPQSQQQEQQEQNENKQ